jgi:hypothetical protein
MGRAVPAFEFHRQHPVERAGAVAVGILEMIAQP